MSGIQLDRNAFFRRLKRIYEAWQDKSDPLGISKVDSIVCALGANIDDDVYAKSLSLQTWLFGCEIPDTVLILGREIIFLGSRKKLDFLKDIETKEKKEEGLPRIKLISRDKSDNDKRNFESLIKGMSESKDGKCVGVFTKDMDNFKGPFFEAFKSAIDSSNLEKFDVSIALGNIMAVKESDEIRFIKKASQASSDTYSKYVKEQIMEIIDGDKKVNHAKLSEDIETSIKDSKYVTDLDMAMLEVCYPPIVQSGGNYKLKFSAVSDKENIHFGAIVSTFGLRYKSYCSNIARTILVNPNDYIKKAYDFLWNLEELIFMELKDGVKFSDVYNKVIEKTKADRPDLVEKLTKEFGFAMGIEFREKSLSVAPNCHSIVRKGMVLNINIGLHNLENKNAEDSKGKVVSLFIGDTVMVNDPNVTSPTTLLTPSKKKLKHISVYLGEEESEKEVEEEKVDTENFGRGRRTAVIEQKFRDENEQDEKRKENQKQLMEELNRNAAERLKNGGSSEQTVKEKKAPISYKSGSQLPKGQEVKDLKIYVDKTYETVILPIFGIPVPFHIATIKNVSISDEGSMKFLRINFYHPGATIGDKAGGGFSSPQDATYVKEITYSSTNLKEPGEISAPSSNLDHAFSKIKDVQKTYRLKEAEAKVNADLVKQDILVIGTGKNAKIKDLIIRPNITQKRISGILEAHKNGFRYTSIRGDKVDLMYNNIKHAFYVPCDKEMIILVHFTLKNAIVYNKKKHQDIQFYAEVGEISTDLSKRGGRDQDELASEQRERELRNEFKKTFKLFCEKVKDQTKGEIEFDEPFRELGFQGVPNRETVWLLPTTTCLVSLSQFPPFVITLDEIELVHFERIALGVKNFDMVFILKDYSKKVVAVNAIPMTSLDHVKNWLNSVDITYREGVQSLNWAKIMKTITEDPEAFFETGGWSFLSAEGGSDASENEDEDLGSDDEEFAVSEESGSDDEEDSEDDYSSEDASDEDYDNELGSDESSGKEWSDLEQEAKASDDNKSDGEHNSKKRKIVHKSSHKSSHKDRHEDRKQNSVSKHDSSSKHKSDRKDKSHKSHHKDKKSNHEKSKDRDKGNSHHKSSSKDHKTSKDKHHESSSSKGDKEMKRNDEKYYSDKKKRDRRDVSSSSSKHHSSSKRSRG